MAGSEGAIGFDARKMDGGFKVVTVLPGGPAEKSGLQIGDVIRSIDGKPVTSVGQADFYGYLNKKPGDMLQVLFVRNGKEAQAAIPVDLKVKPCLNATQRRPGG